MKNKDRICLFELRASLGEFHVFASELFRMYEAGYQVHVLFLNKKIEGEFYANPTYANLLKAIGKVISRKQLPQYLLLNRNKIYYIFREFSAVKKYSISRCIRFLCPHAKLILFPHAFSFHYVDKFSIDKLITFPEKSIYDDVVDYLLIFTEDDRKYFEHRFDRNITRVIQPSGLSTWWKSKLAPFVTQRNIGDSNRKENVLLTIRPPHNIYLSEETYAALIQELIAFFEGQDVNLFVKAHPRQSEETLKLFKEKSWIKFSVLDNFSSSFSIDYVISFWSSSVMDFAAFEIPTIEYYRYEDFHNQLTYNAAGELVSLYVALDITKPATNISQLGQHIQQIRQNRAAYIEERKNSLMHLYDGNEPLELDKLTERKKTKAGPIVFIKYYMRILYYAMKN